VTQSTLVLPSVPQRIADELAVGLGQVVATVGLLDDGATVPFIARYRKEVTGALDDVQLRTLAERLTYLRELEERRAAILESVDRQGKLDDVVRASILSAETKARLEDVYLPFKPKRQTKAQIARDAGLEPLLDRLLADPRLNPLAVAAGFVAPDRGVADVPAALEGARAIMVERFTEDADLLADLRQRVWSRGSLVSAVREGKQAEGATFADWFDHREALRSAPSHRVLALFRGEKQDVLDLSIDPEDVELTGPLSWIEARIAQAAGIVDAGRPGDTWLLDGVRWSWRTRGGTADRGRRPGPVARDGRGRGGAGLRRQPA
jgi:protein Tex